METLRISGHFVIESFAIVIRGSRAYFLWIGILLLLIVAALPLPNAAVPRLDTLPPSWLVWNVPSLHSQVCSRVR